MSGPKSTAYPSLLWVSLSGVTHQCPWPRSSTSGCPCAFVCSLECAVGLPGSGSSPDGPCSYCKQLFPCPWVEPGSGSCPGTVVGWCLELPFAWGSEGCCCPSPATSSDEAQGTFLLPAPFAFSEHCSLVFGEGAQVHYPSLLGWFGVPGHVLLCRANYGIRTCFHKRVCSHVSLD